MKKKEREHLKEDPFQVFIQKTLGFLETFKKQILIGIAAAAVIIIAVFLISFLKAGTVSTNNRLYSEAQKILESDKFTLDQKIEKLNELDKKSGISSSISLSLAALYFEKGDVQKAKEALDKYPGSDYKMINDKKTLMEAEIMDASGKSKEALDMLYKIFSDAKSEVAKDFILLKMARIQLKTEKQDTAIANLKKLTDEYPQSYYLREAQALLKKAEKK
jgi:predicted negative regulator of RcsB-dependent stress response